MHGKLLWSLSLAGTLSVAAWHTSTQLATCFKGASDCAKGCHHGAFALQIRITKLPMG